MLPERLSSLRHGSCQLSSMSSKSRSLQFERSNSRTSTILRPCSLRFNMSSVSLPENVSFASKCSCGSMLMPSKTLSFLRVKMQKILQSCLLLVIGLQEQSRMIKRGKSLIFVISYTSTIRLLSMQSSIKPCSSSRPSIFTILLFSKLSCVNCVS